MVLWKWSGVDICFPSLLHSFSFLLTTEDLVCGYANLHSKLIWPEASVSVHGEVRHHSGNFKQEGFNAGIRSLWCYWQNGWRECQGNGHLWTGNQKAPQSQKFWQWSQILAASSLMICRKTFRRTLYPPSAKAHIQFSHHPRGNMASVFPLTSKSLTVRT